MKKKLYLALASLNERRHTLEQFGAIATPAQRSMHDHVCAELSRLEREYLPSGSGFNSGTKLNHEQCFSAAHKRNDRLFFETAFQHMTEHGAYDGWTRHSVVVRPMWEGIDVHVTGSDRNQIKEFIADTFHQAMNLEIEYAPVPTPTLGQILEATTPAELTQIFTGKEG